VTYKDLLIETRRLLALDNSDDIDEDWFKYYFDKGYSPKKIADKYIEIRRN
jgi:hypothetical protein